MTALDRSSSSDSVPQTAHHVGIDVRKASLEIALIGSEEDASASQTVSNNKDGFDQLLSWIETQAGVRIVTRLYDPKEKQRSYHLDRRVGWDPRGGCEGLYGSFRMLKGGRLQFSPDTVETLKE